MAIDRGLYSAPEGLEDENEVEVGLELGSEGGSELEIEIVDPEMVTLDDGSVEITMITDGSIRDHGDL